MPELAYVDERMDKAIAFCWETQKVLSQALANQWDESRKLEYIRSRAQLWRRFPHGIRTEAHHKFMRELHEQLNKPIEQRNPDKPVWLNEYTGFVPYAPGDGRKDASADVTLGARER